jgi:predicted LPLAT superfamily acyltransferase
MAATAFGLELTWLIYRLFGKRALDLVAWAVGNIVWASDPKARRAAGSRRKLVNFAVSLGDKIAVLSKGRGQPKIRLDGDGDAGRFVEDVVSKKGVVVISSHLGNIETLAAYGECAACFHVFMALSLTRVFRMFKERHSCRTKIEVHPTEGFSMAELFMGSGFVERGDVVLIAGDRGGGRFRELPFLGGTRRFPEGAFRFAKHLERPVYFVASVRERGGYRVFAKLLSAQDALGDYVRELERLVKLYPEQWYQWNVEGGENG